MGRPRTSWGFAHVEEEASDPATWIELSPVPFNGEGWRRADEVALALGTVREAAGRLWRPDPKSTAIEWWIRPAATIKSPPWGDSCQLAALLTLLHDRGWRLRSVYSSLGRVWVSCALDIDPETGTDCLRTVEDLPEKLAGFHLDPEAKLFVGPLDKLRSIDIGKARLVQLAELRSAVDIADRIVLGLEVNELDGLLRELGIGRRRPSTRLTGLAALVVALVGTATATLIPGDPFATARVGHGPGMDSVTADGAGYSPVAPDWMRAEDACGPVRFVPRPDVGGLVSGVYVSGTVAIDGSCAHEPDQNAILEAAVRAEDAPADAAELVIDRFRRGSGTAILIVPSGAVPEDRPIMLHAIDTRARAFTRSARFGHDGRLVGEGASGYAIAFRRDASGPRAVAVVRFPGNDQSGYTLLCDEQVAAGDILLPAARDESLQHVALQFGLESAEELLNAVASCVARDGRESYYDDAWREDLRQLLRPIVAQMGTGRRHAFARGMGRPECVSEHDQCLTRCLAAPESSRRDQLLLCYADLLQCVGGDDDQNDVIEVLYEVLLQTGECAGPEEGG